MISPNEFWLQVHRLADAYQAEGLTLQERHENILDQLREMPAVARRSILADLLQIAANIPDLYSQAVAAASEAEALKKRALNEGAA